MILSHQHRFIYIKTYKAASTSIEAALSEVCGPDDVITPTSRALMKVRETGRAQNWRLDHPMVPKRPLLRRLLQRPERFYHPSVGFYEHMPAWRIKAYVGDDIWNSYFKFTFERNPWDREVSWYYYKTKSFKRRRRPTFNEFLRDRERAWVENYDLYSIDDDIVVDFVGRYESLADDFSATMERIGLAGKVALPVTNVSSSKELDYRYYYDEIHRDLIADWYAREIESFGYKF